VVSGRMPSSWLMVACAFGLLRVRRRRSPRRSDQSCERLPRAGASGPPRVLVLPGDVEGSVDLVGRLAHMLFGERRPEPVVDHRVDEVRIAKAAAPPRAGQQVRRICHRLHPARDGGFELPQTDQLVGVRDRGQAREAHVVERDRGDLLRDSGGDRRLARTDLPGAGLHHVSHHDVIDLGGRYSGASYRFSDRYGAEVDRRAAAQRRAELAHRGSDRRNDDRVRHVCRVPSAPV
jgi:hypothetical protein